MGMVVGRAIFMVAAGTALLVGRAGAQVPTFEQAVGHAFGARITQHHEMVHYLERLAETSPRVTVERLGESWEGRVFLVAIVTAQENHARLEAIRTANGRLADPRGLESDEAATLIADQPAVVWFGGSIHGFELSGSEGALKLLEHLTTRNDPATMEVLRNTVVLIDPMLNPDGRDAFAHINHEYIGREPSPNRDDWSNDFSGWQALKFRTGHYFFDNNRDWFAHTQPVARDRVAFFMRWPPQVAVDMHEMSPDVEFYFDPPGDPANPYFPAFSLRWFETFGDAYAAAFDSAGFEYMTRERYNYFYPGYTSSRAYQGGAVAMLYEQASTRGLTLTRGDGTVRTLADALEQQYLAAWTATRVAAGNRERLLREYLDSKRAAISDGRRGIRRYLVDPREGDPGLVRELVHLLARNGVEIDVLGGETRLSGVRDRTGRALGQRTFPTGTFVVETAQPTGRLIGTLLEPETPIPEDFLRLARTRVERAENPRFYDITGWSLPLLFNLGVYGTTDGRALTTASAAHPEPEGATDGGPERASYAYLLDGSNAATAAALYHLKARGYRAAVLTAPSRIDGQAVASGTGIVRVGQNDSTMHAAVRDVARRYGIAVRAVATGLADSGFPALGSGDHTFNLKPSTIAILAEDGVQGYSFGWAWYTLDRQYEIPVTVLKTRSVAGTELERYDVIVVPSGSSTQLATALGEDGLERLKRWVQDGGTLVTIGGSTDFARTQFELALRSWYDTDDGKDAQRFNVPGAIFRTELNKRHWATAGYDGDLPVLVGSSRIYLAPDGAPNRRRRVIATYAATAPRIAGHAWPESLDRLAGAVFAYEERVGGGRVIIFAEDVNFRGYHRGLNRLFLNAVVLGPSAP